MSQASRIAIIGDVHAEFQRLRSSLALLEGSSFDLAVLTGDIGLDPPWNSPAREQRRAEHDDSVRHVLELVHETLRSPVVFVPGNHDLRDPPPARGAIDVDGQAIDVAGLRVIGLGGAGPAQFGFPYEWTEEHAESALTATFAGSAHPVDIFLSHTPPAGTPLDRTHHGQHVGSVAVRRRIGSARPGLFVCGHIHESWGVTRLDGVPSINAGALGAPAEQDIAWRVTWERGPTRIEMLRRDADGGVLVRTWDPGDEATR